MPSEISCVWAFVFGGVVEAELLQNFLGEASLLGPGRYERESADDSAVRRSIVMVVEFEF